MSPPDRSASLTREQAARGGSRIWQSFLAAPLPVKILQVAGAIFALLVLATLIHITIVFLFVYVPLLLAYGIYCISTAKRTVLASATVAVTGLGVVVACAHGHTLREPWYALLLLLPIAVACAAHLGPLGRWFVPCRTVAWATGWALPFGIAALILLPARVQFLAPAVAWLVGLIVLGWRLAKALQEGREQARRQAAPATVAAPFAVGGGGAGSAGPLSQAPRPGQAGQAGQAGPAQPRSAPSGPSQPGQPAQPGQPGSGQPGQRILRAAQAEGNRAQGGNVAAPASAAAAGSWPPITVDEAIAELDAMIGLGSVKDQVRSITASVEAARRRAVAGHSTEKPMQHFVFLGPPGTGKTAVARIMAKVFYAFGLLESPVVVEAQRADFVGEYLGATAIKTNELINSALGGVLFVDEAYSLVNDGDGQADRFGNEAVQTLVKRAEDDREKLIIILAGYERQMESFLSSNPGLNSRFGVRVKFGTYTPDELLALAEKSVTDKGELLDPDARPVLRHMFEEIGRRRLADELGNGRFVRNLLARAGQQRDVRVMAGPGEPTAAELVTLRGEDLQQAYAELTTRFRGYTDTPTVDGALAELDALVGLEPVKRQVHEIVAQLQVARLRDRQGLMSQPPSRHFVFTGPPGTGKTTVARIIGRIFAALGLLVRPEVIEAHRADLVGEHLGSTAIKTSRLIDSAMGGVLFIDEAYALHNEAYSGGDAFGSEAIATLLKRAEDDRDRLVIVLAGYTADMDRLLRSNPGLASRFSTRITFPSYTATELRQIAEVIAAQAGDTFAADAEPVLQRIFAETVDQGRVDALGNGRFARSLFERACASRDVRVSLQGDAATAADLTTVLAADVETAYRELAA
jgi:SpoVK/Ycf46/Vps4 family AAA+-type ATPase